MSTSVWPLILSSAENFVLINFVLSIAAFTVAALVRIIARKFIYHPLSLTRFFGAALVAPPVISAWLVSASLLPAIWLGSDRWMQEHNAPHTFHLLNGFTFKAAPFLGYATLAFILAVATTAVCAAARAYTRLDRIVGRLQVDAEPAAPGRVKQVEDACLKHGIEVGLVVSRYPFSFVWGYFRSKLIISTGLLNALTSAELSALLEHEAAHHARRDNLFKWTLSICRYASPAFPLMGLLYRWWGEQVEMVCDEVAAGRVDAPIEVASALVRLRRLTASPLSRKPQAAESGFFGESDEIFEQRVRRLLSLADRNETQGSTIPLRSWFRPATLAAAVFALTLAASLLISPLAIHRLIETLLHPF
jgi:Zn-dependent protease with chaperone function